MSLRDLLSRIHKLYCSILDLLYGILALTSKSDWNIGLSVTIFRDPTTLCCNYFVSFFLDSARFWTFGPNFTKVHELTKSKLCISPLWQLVWAGLSLYLSQLLVCSRKCFYFPASHFLSVYFLGIVSFFIIAPHLAVHPGVEL